MDLRRETFSITFLPEFERGWDSQKLELSADCRWNELCSKSCRNSALGAAHIVRNVFRKGSQTVDGASMNQPDTFASLPRRKFPVLVDVHAAEHLPDLATVSIRRDKDTTLRSRVKHFLVAAIVMPGLRSYGNGPTTRGAPLEGAMTGYLAYLLLRRCHSPRCY